MKKTVTIMLLFTCLMIFTGNSKADQSADLEQLPEVQLNVPENKEQAKYLGLTGEAGSPFTLSQIEADILFIELFSMYCPYCQKAAPKVNELYELMENNQHGLKLKIIGIGANNTKLEVETFSEGFDIKFPTFPDKDMSIYKTLTGAGTPTFIGCKKTDGENSYIFFRKSGGFKDTGEFLKEVLERSQSIK